jgi:arylsulfatase A-like enzyme
LWEISPAGPFDRWPTGLGFENFYGFMNGMESQWNPPLYRNTTPVDPADRRPDYHFTTDITDEAIAWIRTHESFASQKPYFAYFATAAVHAPHHVPREWIDKYRGQFDGGWDRLRQQIFVRQKQLGVIPETAELTPRPAAIPPWNSLSVDERRLFARQMEVYAGFVSHTDHEVGRLIEAVKRSPTANNTLIIYIVGDNGSDGTQQDGFTSRGAAVKDQLKDIAELGGPGTINGYAAGWAWLGSTPFQWWKSIASHFGGVRDPMIISWPGRIKDLGALRSQFTHVTDVAATLYNVTGIAPPPIVDGVSQQPLDGISFARSFIDPNASPSTRTQYFEMLGNRALYKDGWLAAARHWQPWETLDGSADFRQDHWELYHVSGDFSEMHDLAAQDPEKLRELQQVFDREAKANDVYPLGGASASQPRESRPTQIVYYPSLPRMPTAAAPDFSRSHRITAEVTIPGGGAEGVIVSDGSRYYGFTLYAKHDRLVYEANSGRERTFITSDAPLPRGHVELAFDLTLDGLPLVSSSHATEISVHVSGMGQLFINGQSAGKGRMEQVSNPYFGSFDIGQARLSSVSTAYEIPFKFTGTIEQVKVELR